MTQRGPPAWVTDALDASEVGRLLNPIVLIGDLQDQVPRSTFLRTLLAQGRLARHSGKYEWCRQAQAVLIRYEGWRHEDACALVSAPDPGQNLPPGVYPPKVDWSHKSFYWDQFVPEPSVAPQRLAATSHFISM